MPDTDPPAPDAPDRPAVGSPSGRVRGDLGGARRRAVEYLDGRRDLNALADSATARTERGDLGRLEGVVDDLKVLIRLVRAYTRGEYRDVSTENLVLAVAGIIYFVSPLDLIPDFLGPLGLGDDAVVMGYVLRFVKEEIDAFRAWEAGLDRPAGSGAQASGSAR